MSDKRCTFPDCFCGGPDECGEARDAPTVRPGPFYPRHAMEKQMKLTGKKRFRVGWFGCVILQLEWKGLVYDNDTSHSETAQIWLDARPEDITELAQ